MYGGDVFMSKLCHHLHFVIKSPPRILLQLEKLDSDL
jgi:hypothetical protein